jgi:hypothetical protein
MRKILAVLLGVVVGMASVACGAEPDLVGGFADPPNTTKP